jgi:hypothetical protein
VATAFRRHGRSAIEIVGVVGDVRNQNLKDATEAEIYTAAWQDVFSGMSFVVRTSVAPASLSAAVRQTVRELDAAVAKFALRHERDRPADVCGDCAAVAPGGAASLLDSGAAGDESGPAGRFTMRMIGRVSRKCDVDKSRCCRERSW